jgi:dipeptidyl aminopeptidase/acylaminoacyl peptidase
VFNAKSAQDEVLRIGSPVTHLTAASPPILTLHGKADATVDHHQALELDRVARERGARHEMLLLEGVGHTFDLQTWAKKPLPRDLRPVVLGFLEQHLGPPVR